MKYILFILCRTVMWYKWWPYFIKKPMGGAAPRWWRNRMGRPLSPQQIHQKIIWMLSNFYKKNFWTMAEDNRHPERQPNLFKRRDLITGLIPLSPFDSPFSPPSHLYLLPPSSLLYLTLWISLGVPGCGGHLGIWFLARLLSPFFTPPFLLLVTSTSLLPLLFSI